MSLLNFQRMETHGLQDSGYTSPVAVGAGSYNAFASEVEHHFYRVQCKSTTTGQSADFKIFYNFVNDKGSAFL